MFSDTVFHLLIYFYIIILGKGKWKSNNSKQTMQRHSYPQQTQTSSPMLFNAYSNAPTYPDPRGQVLPPYDPYFYSTQAQHYYPTNYPSGNLYPNGYRPQIQNPQPRPYLTITQFNYQPIGYSPQSQNGSSQSSLVFGPPPRDRRDARFTFSSHLSQQYELERPTSPKNKLLELNGQSKVLFLNNASQNEEKFNCLRLDDKSDSSGSFEFTIQPEQIVNSLCDDKEQDNIHRCPIPEEETPPCHMYSPRIWPEGDVATPTRIEDGELTKFIVEGCLKAETIAVRNQHRPCFKNIKHLCTRTRTDILKPRTTVANIHSQGIPWATKDFIFAFVRLINCWYILKGYLDDHDGSLGKIETTLTTEFKECYQKWQNNNKEMIRHLINIFVSLDNGITVQNAEIFSTFNQIHNAPQNNTCSFTNVIENQSKNTPPKTKFPSEQPEYSQTSKLQSQSDIFLETNKYNISELFSNNVESATNLSSKLKHSQSEGRMSVPGILRVKEIFNEPNATSPKNDEDTDSERENKHKIYMKPGSYRVPQRSYLSSQGSPRVLDIKEEQTDPSSQETNTSNPSCQNPETKDHNEQYSDLPTPEDVWKNALESIGPFMKTVLQDSESSYGSPLNSQHPDKRNLSSESSDKEYEILDEGVKNTPKNTKDTQAWVEGHSLENCMDENIEEIAEKSKKIDKRIQKPAKKNHISTRTYRKKSDDAIIKKSSKNKVDSFQNQNDFKKNDNILTSMYFLSSKHLGMSTLTINKFEKIINALWNLQFAKYITFEVNVENVSVTNKMASSVC